MTELLTINSIEHALVHCYDAPHVYIGYSGGIDSHVLLHLCAYNTVIKAKLTAVYIHHGLQVEAESWARHCQETAESLGVGFRVLRVNAEASQGESPEEAARNARYKALKSLMAVNDALLVAQHREDQLETVLLQLMRGSGLRGLSGMPYCKAFGQGVLLRPLLDVTKQAINDYAKTHALSWVEDPSNNSSAYDRNFLRNEVVPLLKQRWPHCDKTVARSARHCADVQILISEQAISSLGDIYNEADQTLCISQLLLIKPTLQASVVREWFNALNLKMPSQAFIERLYAEVISARPDSDPMLSGQGYCVRRYRDKLYCLKADLLPNFLERHWPIGVDSISISSGRRLLRLPSSVGISVAQWQSSVITVKARRGGEKICLPGRQGSHALKNLFQEAGVPPWERETIPLVYLDDKLAALGDQWISAEFYSEQRDGCIRLVLENGEVDTAIN